MRLLIMLVLLVFPSVLRAAPIAGPGHVEWPRYIYAQVLYPVAGGATTRPSPLSVTLVSSADYGEDEATLPTYSGRTSDGSTVLLTPLTDPEFGVFQWDVHIALWDGSGEFQESAIPNGNPGALGLGTTAMQNMFDVEAPRLGFSVISCEYETFSYRNWRRALKFFSYGMVVGFGLDLVLWSMSYLFRGIRREMIGITGAR